MPVNVPVRVLRRRESRCIALAVDALQVRIRVTLPAPAVDVMVDAPRRCCSSDNLKAVDRSESGRALAGAGRRPVAACASAVTRQCLRVRPGAVTAITDGNVAAAAAGGRTLAPWRDLSSGVVVTAGLPY